MKNNLSTWKAAEGGPSLGADWRDHEPGNPEPGGVVSIGGTMAAAITGNCQWTTPYGAYTKMIRPEAMTPFRRNTRVFLGQILERPLLENLEDCLFWSDPAYPQKIGSDKKILKDVWSVPGQFVSRKDPILTCHIDGLCIDAAGKFGVVEIKNHGGEQTKKWKEEGVPARTHAQILHYLGVLPALDFGLLVARVGGSLFSAVFERQDYAEEIAAIQEACLSFYREMVIPGIPPGVIAGDIGQLKQDYAPGAEAPVPLSEEDVMALGVDAAAYLDHAGESRNHKKMKENYEALIRERIGSRVKVSAGRISITRSVSTSLRADPEKMKEAGVFEEYSKESTTDRLFIKEKK